MGLLMVRRCSSKGWSMRCLAEEISYVYLVELWSFCGTFFLNEREEKKMIHCLQWSFVCFAGKGRWHTFGWHQLQWTAYQSQQPVREGPFARQLIKFALVDLPNTELVIRNLRERSSGWIKELDAPSTSHGVGVSQKSMKLKAVAGIL